MDILRRLDSADVACCRAASKIFDDAYPHLRSIKLQWKRVTPSSKNLFKKTFVNLISNMRIVESLCIGVDGELRNLNLGYDSNLVTNEDFIEEWLPKVSQNLKSLSISELKLNWWQVSNVLHFVSAYCHKLIELKVKHVRLSVDNLNPMLMLTSLTLEFIHLYDADLNKLNTCVPNLQVLNLIGVNGLSKPKIHLLNLKSCHLSTERLCFQRKLSLISPRLITLRVKEISSISALYVEAPVLSCLHIECRHVQDAFSLNKFENLKHFSISSSHTGSPIGSILYNLTVTETVEDLTVDARVWPDLINENFRFTLEKLFTVFPKVTCLCIISLAWWELNECFILEVSSKITQGMKGLKTLRIENIKISNSSKFFPRLACVLDQCIGLSEVSLYICDSVGGDVLKSEIAKFVAHWPRLKWRWRLYVE